MRRKMLLLVAVIGCAGFAGLFAGTASAAVARLANGKVIGYQPIHGQAPNAMTPFDKAFSNLDYSGGPVMSANNNTTIVWNPSNYNGTAFQTDSTPSDGYLFGINQYFQDLAHDSGGHANADSVAVQYNDAAGDHANYNSSYGGTYTDTDPLPANGCPAASGDICISDAQIQAELDKFLTAKSLPRDMTHEYFLLTPPDVASCFDSAGGSCSANADLHQAFCAYHSASAMAHSFIYANIPDLTGNSGCDPFIIDFVQDYPNSFADGVLSSLAHEHNESITDPQPNNAWTDWQSGCSGSDETCGGEDGDKCAYYELQDDPNSNFSNNTAYNQVINGRKYWLQPEWSNQDPSHQAGQAGHCLDSWTSNGSTAHASFTQTPGAGNSVSFDASASTGSGGVAEYVWQFNDDVAVGDTPQQFTVETTKPQITHSFAQVGDYTVALTVMTSDGTSDGAAHAVTAGSMPPTAAFTSSPGSPLEGTAVSFNGSGSTDPNPGGKIDGYSWSFGDGSSGTGAAPSHVYAKAGTYHVTLTVTSHENKMAHVTHDVIVADESPTAAFTPPSGVAAGTAASFDGRASHDPDGSIVGYTWKFGDGGSGSGATSSHTYAKAGTYSVSLTVLDSDGHSASVSHSISVRSAGNHNNHGPGPSGTGCTVPRLKHQTLSKAHKLLSASGCSLGKVKKPSHKPRHGAGRHKAWKLLVVGQSPAAQQAGPAGEAIAVTLRWVAVKR